MPRLPDVASIRPPAGFALAVRGRTLSEIPGATMPNAPKRPPILRRGPLLHPLRGRPPRRKARLSARDLARPEDPVLEREAHQLGAAAQTKLLHEPGAIGFDGLDAEPQVSGDLSIRVPL